MVDPRVGEDRFGPELVCRLERAGARIEQPYGMAVIGGLGGHWHSRPGCADRQPGASFEEVLASTQRKP